MSNEYVNAWKQVEASLRELAKGCDRRTPIAEVIATLRRVGALEENLLDEIDGHRRLRNLLTHEQTGDGAQLCAPTPEALRRLELIAEQLIHPLEAAAVMTKAATCARTTPLGEVAAKLEKGASVVYFKDGKQIRAVDAASIGSIVTRAAKGATTTVDLARPVGDYATKVSFGSPAVLHESSLAHSAVAAVEGRLLAPAPGEHPSAVLVQGRSMLHLTSQHLRAASGRLL